MTKLHIIGHRRHLDGVLDAVHRAGVLHIIDVTEDSDVRLPPLAVDAEHLATYEDLRYLKARIDGVLGLASGPPGLLEPAAAESSFDLDTIRRELDTIGPQVESLVGDLDRCVAEQDMLPRHLASLRRLLPLVPGLTDLGGYETVALLIDRRHAGVIGEMNSALAELLGGNFEIISDRVDPDTVGAVLVYPRDRAAVVEALLGREQVTRVRLPAQYERTSFRSAIAAMERRLTELPIEIDVIRGRLDDSIRPLAHWAAASRYLAGRLEQLSVIRRLGATSHTFVLTGWVPTPRVAQLRDSLGAIGPEIVVEEAVEFEGDVPPVAMENVAPARPFEFLVRLLATPRYGSFDPTGLMMLFLPLFVGMMVGDIVYGAVLLGLALWVIRRFAARSPVARDLGRIFVMSAGWSVVWGVIYGEFLGDLGHRWFGLEPLWISREDALHLDTLLVFAIAVGAAHVTLGLVLGVWQATRMRDRRTLSERAAMLGALIGLFFVAGVAAGRLPEGWMTPAVAIVVVATAILIAAGGPMGLLMGPLELVGTIGNVLSYLRIAAIGLASVYLARVANELGATGPLWLGLIVATLFHALNVVLAGFSPTIQALRLHYVEFFGKFVDEGGTPYTPFGAGEGAGRTEDLTTTERRT